MIYQLIDGFKFRYRVITYGKTTYNIALDFLFLCLGELSMRYIMK